MAHSALSMPLARRRMLLVSAAYFAVWLATWRSAGLLDILGSASLWYLPAGLRFCCLLLLGWPGVLLELATNLLVTLLHLASSDAPLPPLFSMAMFWWFYDWYALVLAYGVVLLPLRRAMREPWDLTRPLHGVLFLFAALAVSTLAALAGTFHLLAAGSIARAQWGEVLGSWLIGDLIGILILAPLLLVRVWPRLRLYLEQGRWRGVSQALQRGQISPGLADLQIAGIVLLSLLLVFGIPYGLDVQQHLPLIVLLLLLPQMGLALRYKLRGVVLAVVLLDSGMVLALTLFEQRGQALQYQLVMVAIALVGLWLGGAVESRNRNMLRSQDFANASNDMLWESDPSGRLLSVEGRLARHLALLPGQHWDSLLERVSAAHRAALKAALARQQPFRHLEMATPGRAGLATRWLQINGLPVWDAQGELAGFRGTATDITRAHRAKTLLKRYNQELLDEVAQQTLDLRQQYERVWILAHHDPLTELPNRNLFWDRSAQALSAAKRRGGCAAMLLLDLDGFKRLNDQLGHAAGDALLQQVAQRLRGRMRDSDTVARMGGDEFAILMPDIADAGSALRVAEALLASLGPVFVLPQGQAQISGSMGLALYPQHAQEAEALVRCADLAMYQAKQSGRNRIQLWQAEGPVQPGADAAKLPRPAPFPFFTTNLT